jgi:Serpentine type 7TM GPCR chemoreceptor Srw
MQVINLSEDDANLTDSVPETILGDNRIYQLIYSNVLYYPVMYVLPLVTLTTLNFKLIAALNLLRRRTVVSTSVCRRRPSRHKRNKHDTYCVVVIVFVFIICQTPALFNQIFWAVFEQTDRECGHFHFYYTKLSDLLVVVNSSCNFIVYCLFGRTFRRIFLLTVCGVPASPRCYRLTHHSAHDVGQHSAADNNSEVARESLTQYTEARRAMARHQLRHQKHLADDVITLQPITMHA